MKISTQRTNNNEEAIKREYSNLALEYDRRWAFYVEASLGETLKRLDMKSYDRVLDIGCGTGSLLQRLIIDHPSAKLFGADMCMEMLQVANKKLKKQAAFISANARLLPFHSNSFDLVISCNAFHFMRAPRVCLSEIARVLKPNGKLTVTDWCDFFLRIFNRAHFRTYGTRECKQMLEVSGFKRVHIERFKINWLWGLMTAKAQLNDNNEKS